MQKMLKKYLRFYKVFKNAAEKNYQFVEIVHCKEKTKIEIDERVKLFLEASSMLYDSIKDPEVKKVLVLSFFERQHDEKILSKIHMSQSSFYRIKNKLVDKLQLLCVENGLIKKQEILELIIN